VTDAEIIAAAERVGWGVAATCRALGKPGSGALERRIRALRANAPPRLVIDAPPPDPDLSVEEIIALRRKRFAAQAAHEEAAHLVSVQVKDRALLPIGLLHFGDPHIESPGSDIDLLLKHAEIVRKTDGVWATTVGDLRDNWVGRLAHLWEHEGITGRESWKLAEHWVKDEIGVGKWLYIVGGNHDLWSGSGDPLEWIARQAKALYQASEVRVALKFAGAPDVRVNCRHDFAGHSQWNPAHGPAKALQLGLRDHIGIAGHTHASGYGIYKCPETGILMHAIRVATYKVIDRYARDSGFRDQNVSPCAFTVINPLLPPTHPDLIKLFHDPVEGADFLTWLRKRAERKARAA
jgi:hypothetical protein